MDERSEGQGLISRRQMAVAGLIPLALSGAAAPAQAADASLPFRKLVIADTVRQMRARYGWHAARGDYNRIADLFAPQGLFEVTVEGTRQQFRSREAIRAFLSTNMRPGQVFPFIHNDIVEVADACLEASGTCTMESSPHGRAGAFSGYYHDKAALIDGRWQFTERRFFFYAPNFERSGLDLDGRPETGLALRR